MVANGTEREEKLIGNNRQSLVPKSALDEKRTSFSKVLSFGSNASCPQGPDFSICVLLKMLQAVGSLVAKATGAFRRIPARSSPTIIII